MAIVFPDIDPAIFRIGQFEMRWYAAAYGLGIAIGALICKKLIVDHFSNSQRFNLQTAVVDSFLPYLLLGMIVGARIFYVLIYDPIYYMNNVWEIFKTYRGGLSFHGGLCGVVLAAFIFAQKKKIRFIVLLDILAVAAPLTIGLVRIGNFINAELYGRYTSMPWGVIFPGSTMPRHPSQIYESFAEGFLCLIIMIQAAYRLKILNYQGAATGLFLSIYSLNRIVCEFFREPDIQIGFLFGGLTMGQILCLPMLLVGLLTLRLATK